MLYFIAFDIKDTKRAESFILQLEDFGEYISFLPRCYFLKSNTELQRNDLYKKLKSVLDDEDLFLITETNLNNMSGWLSNSVVEWLKNI
jgi:hypothetical protein